MKRPSIYKNSFVQSIKRPGAVSIAKWAAVVMILACMVVVCMGQRRTKGAPLRIIQLPQPKLTRQGGLSFEEVVVKQRIISRLSNQPISFEQIGQLAWAGQGITNSASQPQGPLSGGTMAPLVQPASPLRLYIASAAGVHLYNPDGHSLEQTFEQDVRNALASAVAIPDLVASAGCCFIVIGPVKDPLGRPASLAKKLILLQAGQSAQNIQLQAASLGLASIPIGDFNERTVSKLYNLPRSMEPLYLISVGYPAGPGSGISTTGQEPAKSSQEQNKAASKRSVLIVPGENFDDRELFETLRVLSAADVQNVIASTKTGIIKGATGGVAEAGILLSQIKIDDYDAVIFIGGEGARGYFNNPAAFNIAREAAARGRVLAAISTAPVILANAGVLRGVRATGFLSEQAVLQKAGAIYTGTPVERQGLIITATGSAVVSQFAWAIVNALAGR